jgi:double-stranded RNA-binding protein Staufen
MKADGSQKEGDVEEYVAQGASIKRAQHAAALMALEKTKFKKPEPKSERKSGMKLAPSVELNTLAMKLGESLSFRVNTPCQPLISNLFQYSPGHPPHILRSPVSVTLRVGNREYYGSGATIQGARHNAASKALVEFRERCAAKERETLNAAADLSAASVEKSVEKFEEILDYKSPISLLHEACIHHDLNVAFSVVNESGPPHLRIFVTRCTVSSIPNSAVSPSEGGQTKALVLPEPVSVEAEGNGKKTSKKKAAEEMLKTLIKTYPNILQGSTKPENVLKEKKCDPAGKATVKKKKMKIIKVIFVHFACSFIHRIQM